MNEKFNFRGFIKPKQDFYMLAVLDKNKVSDLVNKNSQNLEGLASNNVDKYFFLCQNQYEIDGKNYQRLYWSSDPDDFQKSKNNNHMNEGVARVNRFSSNNNFFLRYRTTFNESTRKIPEPGIYKTIGTNFEKISSEESSIPLNFTISNSNFNVDSQQLHYSIPYNIVNVQSLLVGGVTPSIANQLNWSFRKIQKRGTVSSNKDIALPKPTDTASGSSFIYNFVDIQSMNNASGTSSSNFNYGSVHYNNVTGLTSGASFLRTDTVLKVTPYKTEFNNFPQHDSDIRISSASGTSESVLYYNNLVKNHNTAEFYIQSSDYSKGLIGDDFEVEKGDSLNIVLNTRNDPICFFKLSDDSHFSDYFDIYFIPIEENAIFPGGHTILNQSFFPTCSNTNGNKVFEPVQGSKTLKFFNPESRAPANSKTELTNNPNRYISEDCSTNSDVVLNFNKLNSYKKIYNLLLFQTIGSLNTNIWSETGIQAFPNIAKYQSFPITFYTWSNWEQARHAYMYNYCAQESFCGFCYGRNRAGDTICFADHLTRKHASLTSSGNILPPLSDNERATGSNSNGSSQKADYMLGFYIFAGIFGTLSLIYLIIHKDNLSFSDGHLPIFLVIFITLLLVLLYLLAVTKSLIKCEENYSLGCPTFTNPEKGTENIQAANNDSTCQYCTKYNLPDGTQKNLISFPY